MSYDQKPARVRVVGSKTAEARGKSAPLNDAPLEANDASAARARPSAEETVAPPKRTGLILLFVIATALGGLLQAWFLR